MVNHFNPHQLGNLKIVECRVVEHKTKLSWKKRLFSWPWRPWVKSVTTFTPMVPEGQFIVDQANMIAYASPETCKALRDRMQSANA